MNRELSVCEKESSDKSEHSKVLLLKNNDDYLG